MTSTTDAEWASDEADSPRPSRPSRPVALRLVTALSVPFVVLALIQAWRDSPTWDEGIYLASGVTALTERELRINLEHPPLSKVLVAVPALAAGAVRLDDESFGRGAQFTYSGRFMEAQIASGRMRTIVFAARLVAIALSVAVGFAVYALAAGWWGRAAGVAAAALWFLNPFTLGMGHAVNIDVPFTLVVLLTLLALRHAVRARTLTSVLLVGVACGVALLVRMTGLIVAPIVAVTLTAAAWPTRRWRALGDGALVLFVAWACVWGGIRALAPSPSPGPVLAEMEVLTAGAPADVPTAGHLLMSIPWPHEYATGIGYLARVSTPPAPAFVLGHAYDGRLWWYWPASFLVKFPLTTVVAIAAGALRWRREPREHVREAIVVLVPVAVALTAFTLSQPRTIGLRYLLPVIAIMFVAAGPAVRLWERTSGRVILAVIAAVQVIALVNAHPHALAWTTPPFRPAYRYVADANLDWNQDFYLLQAWAPGRDPYVAYSGPGGLGIDDVPGGRGLGDVPVQTVRGWVAVFASLLTTYQRDNLAWLRKYCPVGTLGGSILLYRFDEAPDPTPGPVAPAPPCAEPPSRVVTVAAR